MKPWAWMLLGAAAGGILTILIGKWLGVLGGITVGGGIIGAIAGAHVRELKESRRMRKQILDAVFSETADSKGEIDKKATEARQDLDDRMGGS